MKSITIKYSVAIDFKTLTENRCKTKRKWTKKNNKESKNFKMKLKENHFNLSN